MPEYPECPFCEYRLTEAVLESVESSIKLRCPSCGWSYQYIPEAGSFPLEDDLGITVSKGLLGPHVISEGKDSEDAISLSRALLIGGLCCCTTVVIIPVVLALLLALLG
jgi:hypothetical protein